MAVVEVKRKMATRDAAQARMPETFSLHEQLLNPMRGLPRKVSKFESASSGASAVPDCRAFTECVRAISPNYL